MELVLESLKLERCTDLIHYTHCARKDVECLDCLMLNLLMLDECHGFLCAAEHDVHDLFCLDRIKRESQDILDDVLVHVVELARAEERLELC